MLRQYFDILKPSLLGWDFIEPYSKKEPNFGPIGLITYLRTYSRFIPELGRREHWWETVLRVVEYSLSLDTVTPLPEKKEEAKVLYDYMYEMKVFPAGRTLFVGGSPSTDNLEGTSNFNCSFIQVDSIKAFTDNLYLLMNGCGVGFSVEEKYVKELPQFFDLPIKHKDINPVPKNEREDETTLILNEEESILKIGDSKHGWMVGLQKFLEYKAGLFNTKSLLIDYDWVRPAGERLKKFGGKASGALPLRQMFNEINFIIHRDGNRLTPVGAMDVMNSVAKAIIVGGVVVRLAA